jgi:hypothetical protein
VEDWSRWYKKEHPVGTERCFLELRDAVPPYVDTVIDFGCAAGRNLEAFDGRLKLYGVDLPAESEIGWRTPLRDFTYVSSRLQDLPRKLDVSMERWLCISHGVLMYLAPAEQRSFLEFLRARGCKNFVFQEYDQDTLGKQGYFEPSLWNRVRRKREGWAFSNPLGFDKRWFRPELPTWTSLDVPR